MINNAKVDLSSVKSFEQAIREIRDYSPSFNKGISCIDGFVTSIFKINTSLQKSITHLNTSQNDLKARIKEIEAQIADLTQKINELEDEKTSLESELSDVPETIEETNEEGEVYSVDNPEYYNLLSQIEDIEERISELNEELDSLKQKHDEATDISVRIESHIYEINSIINSLNSKQQVCRQLNNELSEIKDKNYNSGLGVSDKLKKIEELIAKYLRIKMIYENETSTDNVAETNNTSSSSGGIMNININVNKTIVNNEPAKQSAKGIDDIKLSNNSSLDKLINIKHDDYGRICQYDDKTFGGKYISYEDRLKRVPSGENLIQGYFEGVRGESKYIPSDRSAEGIVVIEILKNYNQDGITYRNAEPDFEVCSEAVVTINNMTENRENYADSNNIPKLGNFSQADIECAKLWNLQGRDGRNDWTGREVLKYRKANKLTWHEKCDTKTMVLVRTEINDFFKHSGGCAECQKRDAEQNGGCFDE